MPDGSNSVSQAVSWSVGFFSGHDHGYCGQLCILLRAVSATPIVPMVGPSGQRAVRARLVRKVNIRKRKRKQVTRNKKQKKASDKGNKHTNNLYGDKTYNVFSGVLGPGARIG